MNFVKICLLVFILFLFSGNVKAQEQLDPAQYEDDLVAYLTEVNMWVENQMLLNSCICAENEDFITEYQNVRSAYNAWINSQLMNLGLLKSRKAVRSFQNMNRSVWLNMNPELREAHLALMRFSEVDISSCGNQSLIPGVLTVAELISVSNTVIGLLTESQKRREEQKLLIIQTLEGFKLPPISAYKCSE